MKRRTIMVVLVGAGLLVGGLAVAADLPKLPNLPKAAALAKAEKSPGQVTFRHKTHVKPEAADCTVCHPKMWSMKKGAKKPEITHKAMKKGEYCGKCHEGKKAFGLDECDNCHASE